MHGGSSWCLTSHPVMSLEGEGMIEGCLLLLGVLHAVEDVLVTLFFLKRLFWPLYSAKRMWEAPDTELCPWELHTWLNFLSIQQIFTGLHAKTWKREEDTSSMWQLVSVEGYDLLMHYIVRLSSVKQGMSKQPTGVETKCGKGPMTTLVIAFTSSQWCTLCDFSR